MKKKLNILNVLFFFLVISLISMACSTYQDCPAYGYDSEEQTTEKEIRV